MSASTDDQTFQLECNHPWSHRFGSADTSGKIVERCSRCGKVLVDVQMPAPAVPMLGTPITCPGGHVPVDVAEIVAKLRASS